MKNNKRIINKKKKIGLLSDGIILVNILMLSLVITLTSVSAHGNFNETKQLIDSGISCKELTNEQLEEIGDYYMEQMHPGESHELMHNMVGGENSETTKLMHINMAKSIYCGENVGMAGMMGMMSGDMMGSGMMTGNVVGNSGNMMYGYGWNIYNLLYLILLIGLIILVILIIIKLIRDLKKRR